MSKYKLSEQAYYEIQTAYYDLVQNTEEGGSRLGLHMILVATLAKHGIRCEDVQEAMAVAEEIAYEGYGNQAGDDC